MYNPDQPRDANGRWVAASNKKGRKHKAVKGLERATVALETFNKEISPLRTITRIR